MNERDFDRDHECDKCGAILTTEDDVIVIRTIGKRRRTIYCEQCACRELINRGFAG